MKRANRDEGILVLGAPRSGTTLLRRLLDAHPNIDCPAETNVFAASGRFLRSERIAGGVRVGVLEGLAHAGFAREDVLARLREFAFSFHREHARRQGKKRWAAKTAFDAFYLDEIEMLCGDRSAFVCIERHGLDVACSLHELCERNGVYLGELHAYLVRHPAPLEAFAHVWVDRTRALRAFLERHPDRAVRIRYEDLVADPDATMSRVLSFLGERWTASLRRKALASREGLGLGDWKTYGRDAIDAESVGRWRKLPRDTVGRLGAICNETLERCGYEAVDIPAEPAPAQSQRRHELGLLLQGGRRKQPRR